MSPPDPAVTAERATYSPGDVILGKYQLEGLIGEGGMGTVWRARNTALDAPVALKVIRADLNRESLGVRLLQEARAAARLGHPAIVRVFDVGQTEQGDPFIVMELLEGQSFGAMLGAGRMPPAQAVQMLLPIADALSRAHAKGIVHRDLKPDNVFVVSDEGRLQPKLVDFGIVKVDQRDGGSQLTQVGTVLGSPEYMSPEQARGQDDVDHRTDVWSFAIMLYEATTGTLPFSAANYNALMRLIVETTPPTPRDLAAADPHLSTIIERGMAKNRDERFRSMGEFGRELAQWLVVQGVYEDVCGVSLESKWLTRSSDPAQGRASLVSSPDIVIPPYSGVRGRTPRPSPIAPTTPAHPALTAAKAVPSWAWVVVGVTVAILTTLMFILTRPSAEPADTAAASPSDHGPPSAEAIPKTAAPAPASPPAQPSLEPRPETARAPKSSAPAPATKAKKGAAARPTPPPASATSKAPAKKEPGLDLLSPY